MPDQPDPDQTTAPEPVAAPETSRFSTTSDFPAAPHASDADIASEINEVAMSAQTTEQSQPFIGQWNQLISTTNWDKGAIICQWRSALVQQDAPLSEYSDEAWSHLVGGVTPQHVGRLRRTSERFAESFTSYEGLYWSHFYAALDWDDAEMWLEGAVQNKWSISAMRQQRWETMGKVESDRPQPGDIVTMEAQEETQSLALSEGERQNDREYVEGPVHEGPDFGDESASSNGPQSSADGQNEDDASDAIDTPRPHQVKPFEAFQDLPEDVLEAANQVKVAIIRHKLAQWEEMKQEDMLGLLDALKQLATLAPQ